MQETLQTTGLVCGVLAAAELICRLCPKDKTLSFVRSLTVLVLLASMGAALANISLQWPEGKAAGGVNQELENFLEDQYSAAARDEYESYLAGLLAAAGLEAKKISADVDIFEDGSIVLTRAAAWFLYESDAQRARALLTNALGRDVCVEVYQDGA